ncbi:MAG: DNA-binding protein WhiA [Clostridia bacterium]|nr:DNA-binding protein WhiA [Clostridia bacterium]
MSFSTQIKDEIVRIKLRDQKTRLAQLSGLTLTCGTLRSGSTYAVVYQTESLAVAKHIDFLAGDLFDLDVTMELRERENRRTPLVAVNFGGADVKKLLLSTGAVKEGEELFRIETGIPAARIRGDECRRAFLRGCFLGCGSCVNPKRSYHLEFVCKNEEFAQGLCGILKKHTLSAGLTERKGRFIVYLKDGDSITGFFALIGANSAALQFENVRVEKEVRNLINRRSNCENANMDKSATASARQLAAISSIMSKADISKLPRPLIQAAQLRINHPEATLNELAKLAGIQKSGMNHRLERLMKIARELD